MVPSNILYPEIQIWERRLDGLAGSAVQYQMISTSTANNATPVMIADSLYQYTLSSPVEVSPGDIVAVRVPPKESAVVLPLFKNMGGPFDEYDLRDFDSTTIFFMLGQLGSSLDDRLFPLVTPVIMGMPHAANAIMCTNLLQ